MQQTNEKHATVQQNTMQNLFKSIILLFLLLQQSTPSSLPTTFTSPTPSNLHLRLINNTYVLASTPKPQTTISTTSKKFTPATGDILLRVDDQPLTTLSLATILEQIGTTAILPIIDTTHSPPSSSGDAVDPGWKIRGFVKIETFAAKTLELQPGWPARVQAFQEIMQYNLDQVNAIKEQARVEAETAALRATEAQQVLDKQKHELALQEGKVMCYLFIFVVLLS